VKRLVAICLVITLLSAGLEFASDDSDVFEGTDRGCGSASCR